jgi:hypothetical protein
MSGTKDAKKELKNELNSVLGDYIPNKIDLENLTTYLYKVMLKTINGVDIEKEISKVGDITENDVNGFNRALHTIALSASQRVVFQTLKETYGSIKNKIELVKAQQNENTFVPTPLVSSNVVNPHRMSPIEGEFDIDLSSVGKVSSESVEALRKQVLENEERDRELYEHSFPQRKQYNNPLPDEQEFEMSEEFISKVNMNNGNTNNDSKYDTEEVFDFIPKMSFDMDY